MPVDHAASGKEGFIHVETRTLFSKNHAWHISNALILMSVWRCALLEYYCPLLLFFWGFVCLFVCFFTATDNWLSQWHRLVFNIWYCHTFLAPDCITINSYLMTPQTSEPSNSKRLKGLSQHFCSLSVLYTWVFLFTIIIELPPTPQPPNPTANKESSLKNETACKHMKLDNNNNKRTEL